MKKTSYLFLLVSILISCSLHASVPAPKDSVKKGQTVGEWLREIARKKYPTDQEMQDYIYNEQKDAYFYMLEHANDPECKHFAEKKYPDDLSMQKYVYNEQVEAKEYMSKISSAAKSKAVEQYPDDYSMQKYIYENP